MTDAECRQALPDVARKAAFEARRLIGHGWFRPDEQEDVRQELLVHWWGKRKVIPTSAGTGSAYGAAVLRNRSRDLVRDEHAPVRDRRKSGPLPEEAGERQPILPRALVSEPRHDDTIDVRSVVERLPRAKQRFAWLLAEEGVVAAAQAIGISRSTAWRWRTEICERFIKHGLGRERQTGRRR